MSFSKDWDNRYKENTHMSVWPWSELISYVMRYAKPTKKIRVLELGCGAGANIPFFNALKVEYYGIDGSETIIKKLMKRFPSIKNNLVVDDFTSSIPFNIKFDLIVDRAGITSNPTNGIISCLEKVYDKLNGDGKYIGIDWYSTKHSDYNSGKKFDLYTRYNFRRGQFTGLGYVHFTTKKHLLDLFYKFDVLVLEHKLIKTLIPQNFHNYAAWNIIAQKTTQK